MQQQRLLGKIAVVTGASRNVGRGIALVLGQEGATVYVTGRSSRDGRTTVTRDWKGRTYTSRTIEETAELVTARGGMGIPVQMDHTVDVQVEALFERIEQEQGHVDILVNNVWGGYENMERYNARLWEQPIWRWDAMFDVGARAHFVTSRFAIPLMLPQESGLVVSTTYPWNPASEKSRPRGLVELSKWAVNGLVNALAHQLKKHHIPVVGLAPGGWVWDHDTEMSVREAIQEHGDTSSLFAQNPGLKEGESSEYTGCAVVALATDPEAVRKTGCILPVPDVAREYGFTDIDGRQPELRY